jgi:hypothetical protein
VTKYHKNTVRKSLVITAGTMCGLNIVMPILTRKDQIKYGL